MATVFDDVRTVTTLPQRVWSPFRILRRLPTIPLLILGVLAFAGLLHRTARSTR